jgi:signal transduction histidine kinase
MVGLGLVCGALCLARGWTAGRAPTGSRRAHHGLGLTIVAAIAHMHQGGTLAESRDGRTRTGLWLADLRS